jgi:type III secretory pathway component EscS
MKPHPRIRKTIKRCGAAAKVLLIVSPIWMMAAFVGLSVALVQGSIDLQETKTPPHS